MKAMDMGNVMTRYFQSANAVRAQSVRNIVSGYRINAAKDDPSGLSVAKKMYHQISSTGVASQNAQDAVSMVQVADKALSNVGDMVGRMNQLAVKAGNETLGKQERESLQKEYDQLANEIDKVGQSTNFNGIKLFDSSTYTMQVGPDKGDTIDLKFGEISAAALGLDKADLSTSKGANEAAGQTKDVIKSISSQRGDLGASEKGLKSVIGSLGVREENLTASLSRIMDADMGKESINRGLSNTMAQVSLSLMKNSQYLMQYNAMSLLFR